MTPAENWPSSAMSRADKTVAAAPPVEPEQDTFWRATAGEQPVQETSQVLQGSGNPAPERATVRYVAEDSIWIAEDATRQGCWHVGPTREAALAGLADAREHYDDVFRPNPERTRCCDRHHAEGCCDGAPGCCPRCPINPAPALESGRTDERPCVACGLPDAACAGLIYGSDGYGCCGNCAHWADECDASDNGKHHPPDNADREAT
jgi:hypothetical protein